MQEITEVTSSEAKILFQSPLKRILNGEYIMMKIETEQDPFDCFDQFKLTGTLKFGDAGEKAIVVISTSGSRKSEAVEKAIKTIDELVKFLNDSKEKLGAI